MPLAYYPENKQRLPEDADGDIRPNYGTKAAVHLKTALPKPLRGMEKIGPIKPGQLLGPEAERKVGWTEYLCTPRAIELLEAQGLKLYRAHYYD